MPVANIGSSAYELDWDIAQQSQNVGANTSQVYGRLILRKKSGSGYWSNGTNSWNCSIDGQTFGGTFTYDFRNYSELMLWQGTVTISHNADGTKTIGSWGNATIGSPSGSASVIRDNYVLSTIPRSSQPTISGSVVTGNSVTINTNRASGSFTHTVRWGFGNMTGTVATGVTTSTSWSVPHNLLTQIPNASSGTGAIYLDTYNGGTFIGTKSVSFKLTPGSTQVPTLTGATLAEAVTSPVNIASVVGGYVQSQSKLNYTINGAAGIQGSTIASYKFQVGSVIATSSSGTTDFLQDSGTVNISVTVTDTRGQTSAPWTTTINVIPWTPPQITTINVERALASGVVDPAGTYLKVTLIGSISSLMVGTQKNALTYKTDTSLAGDNTWVNKRNTSAGSVTTINVSYVISSYIETSSFDVRTQLIDRFATTTVIKNVSVAGVALDIGLTNVGVGKFWQQGTLDVGGDIYSSNILMYPDKGTSTQRDTYFGIPSTDPQRVALANLTPTWFNTSTMRYENYFAVTGTSGLTARGVKSGHNPGWYPVSGSVIYLNSTSSSDSGTALDWQNLPLPAIASADRNDGFTNYSSTYLLPPVTGIWTVVARVGIKASSAGTTRGVRAWACNASGAVLGNEWEFYLRPSGWNNSTQSFTYVGTVATNASYPYIVLSGYADAAVARFLHAVKVSYDGPALV